MGKFAAVEFFGGPAAGGGDALLAEFEWGLDEDGGVAVVVPAGFEEECGIEHDGFGGLRGVADLVQDFGLDSGLHDAIQGLAAGLLCGRISEDESSEFWAVDFAVCGCDLGAEVLYELAADGWHEQLLVSDAVGVDHMNGEPCEGGDDRRLP